MFNDPYQVLGVARTASDREIKKAYRTLSRKYHPDNYTDPAQKEQAEEQFRRVQEAYNAIVDERSGKTSGYGGYGGGGYTDYSSGSEEDRHLMAAINYIRNGRYNEAINVLNGISNRSARWYYLSSVANLGLNNTSVALDYAKQACSMEPDNQEYRMYYQRLQNGNA
ncbi:MAG: DnaJ domain-containing protein, partial [Eubacterium sp.]|nr:DnaJ domain-containing protein [Eubacterium sp.]